MCGRYTLTTIAGELAGYGELIGPGLEFGPHYNISPGQSAPVIIADHAGPAAKLMRWGLVPFWAKDESIGFKTINARSETVAERASFKHALRKRRCLVLADGFYEWAKVAGGKQPHYFYLTDHRPFCFAGLWESWDKGEGPEPLTTFTILTTAANAVVQPVHDRMPVIIGGEQEQTWLDHRVPPEALEALYAPFAAAELRSHPVGSAVGNSRNNGPQLIEPV